MKKFHLLGINRTWSERHPLINKLYPFWLPKVTPDIYTHTHSKINDPQQWSLTWDHKRISLEFGRKSIVSEIPILFLSMCIAYFSRELTTDVREKNEKLVTWHEKRNDKVKKIIKEIQFPLLCTVIYFMLDRYELQKSSRWKKSHALDLDESLLFICLLDVLIRTECNNVIKFCMIEF